MKYLNLAIAFTLVCAGLGILAIPGRTASAPVSNETSDATSDQKSEQGRHIFRFDTFGDQAFWGGSLKLHQAIEGSKFGGVGPGVSPTTALAVGLKVDVDTLPRFGHRSSERWQSKSQRSSRDPCLIEAELRGRG